MFTAVRRQQEKLKLNLIYVLVLLALLPLAQGGEFRGSIAGDVGSAATIISAAQKGKRYNQIMYFSFVASDSQVIAYDKYLDISTKNLSIVGTAAVQVQPNNDPNNNYVLTGFDYEGQMYFSTILTL